MQIIYRFFFIIFSCVAPRWAFAVSSDEVSAIVNHSATISDMSDTAYSVFSIHPKDISINFLSRLFGQVGDVLPTTHHELIGAMLSIFNIGIWVIAAGIVSFMVTTTVIHTAKEGELMGQRAHVLTLFRAALGVVLLVPKTSGYSFIHIIIIWVVVQGINFADAIWSTAIGYLANQGTVSSTVSPDRYKSALPLVGDILRSEVCMYLMQAQDQKTQILASGLANSSQGVTYTSSLANTNLDCWKKASTQYIPDYSTPHQVSFGTPPSDCGPSVTPGVCGIYNWGNLSVNEQAYVGPGITQMVSDLSAAAYQIAQNALASVAIEIKNKGLPADQQIAPGPSPDPCLSADPSAPPCWADSILQAAAINYVNTLAPLAASANPSSRLSIAEEQGWVIGAVYYRDLIPYTHQQGGGALDPKFVIINSAPALPKLVSAPDRPSHFALDLTHSDNQALIKYLNNDMRPMELAFTDIGYYGARPGGYLQVTTNNIDAMTSAWNTANSFRAVNTQIQHKYGSSLTNFKDNFSSLDTLVGEDVNDMVDAVWNAWKRLTQPPSSMGIQDLIGAQSLFGMELMHAVLTFWSVVTGHIWERVTGIAVGFTAAMGVISALGGLIEDLGVFFLDLAMKYPLPFIILWPLGALFKVVGFTAFQSTGIFVLLFKITITIIFWYLPLFLFVGVPIFMTGVLLGVFAPLIPYLLFTFGVFGWFIAILEAMVAGPLIALGVAHPSGQHDYLGRAEQAIMLLLSILLRPATMIMGLLAGTLLSFISLQLLQMGFSAIFNDSITQLIQNSHGLGSLGMFAVILSFILLYTTIAMILINRCFSLIYIIADRLTRWIGAQPEQSMPDSVLEHVKGEMSRVVQGVAGSQSQTDIEMTKSVSPSPFSYMGGPRKEKK